MSTITTEKIRISFAPTNSVCKENDKPYVKKSSIKIPYGKPSKQIKIENVNDENNIRTINKTLHHSDIISMKKIDLNDLFKLKSISYASTKDKSLNDESTDSVSTDSVSSDSVPPKDEPSKDESNEVKLIKCLLLKVQNLEKVLINTGNGNKDELQSISKSISSLTDKLKTIV
jgi:hypothetical protein